MSEPKAPKRRIYLDFNASSPPSADVAKAVAEALVLGGNPSSSHKEGREARARLEQGRQALAAVLSVEALDLVFCSGGTEANHLGLAGLARARRSVDEARRRVLLPGSVHPSLLEVGKSLSKEGFVFESVPVDSHGRVDVVALAERLDPESVAVLGFSLVNHELGSLDQAQGLARLASAGDFYLFCDAVQGLGKISIDIVALGVHALSISAHKIGGPQGIGALWLRPGPDVRALFGGGKQEGSRRPGTQAVALVAGLEAALGQVDSQKEHRARLAPLWHKLREGLVELGAIVHSDSDLAKTLSSTLSARFPGIPGDVLVSSLDLAGIAISTGAACSSGTVTPSTGLLAIGLNPTTAMEAIRVSMGPSTQDQDIEALLKVLPAIVARAKRFSA